MNKFRPYFIIVRLRDVQGIEIQNNPNSEGRWALVIGEMNDSLLIIPMKKVKKKKRERYDFEVFLSKKSGCIYDSILSLADLRTIRREDVICRIDSREANISASIHRVMLYECNKFIYANADCQIANTLYCYETDNYEEKKALALSNLVRISCTSTSKAMFLVEEKEIRVLDMKRTAIPDKCDKNYTQDLYLEMCNRTRENILYLLNNIHCN